VTLVEPEYVCALITDPRAWLLWQVRPAASRHAPGQLTCFGGRREDGENAEAALRRELAEELAWQPTHLTPAAELWKGPRFIARFYHAPCTQPTFTTEPGHHAVWAPPAALPGLPISPWHRAVLDALAAGHCRAEVPI
jgi:8-oxo-dGTP pyrophosphatase MutT (NUDIX family)